MVRVILHQVDIHVLEDVYQYVTNENKTKQSKHVCMFCG